jgi:hypothetical protein
MDGMQQAYDLGDVEKLRGVQAGGPEDDEKEDTVMR